MHLYLLLASAFIVFLVWYSRTVTRRARAECVGYYPDFWLTFLAWEPGDPIDRVSLVTPVDERDVETLLRHRRRYLRVVFLALAVFGLAICTLPLTWL
jgi:hypothetical protein